MSKKYAQEYDETFGFFKDYSQETIFLQGMIQQHRPQAVSVIDIACGTGTHIIALSKLGYRCAGIDLNEDILVEAAEKASQAQTTVNWYKGDMKKFTVAEEYSVALNLFYAMQNALYSYAEQLSCLQSIHTALEMGGILIIEILPEENNIKQYPAGKKFLLQESDNEDGSRLKVYSENRIISDEMKELVFSYHTIDLSGNESIREIISPLRRMYLESTRQLFCKAGFAIVAEYGDYAANTFNEESKKIIFVAQKR